MCRFAVLLLLGMLVSSARSAPSPSEDDAWRLLARRVEAQQFRHFTAEGDAEVQWGSRRVRAQRIEGDMESGWITATGDVFFADERGTLRASQMRFNLKTREGDLSDVRGEIEGIFITAESLRSDGNMLTMQEVTLTTCDKQTPDFLLSARSLSLSPALRLRARQVSLSAWGHRWVTVPYLSRRIGRREPGECPSQLPCSTSYQGAHLRCPTLPFRPRGRHLEAACDLAEWGWAEQEPRSAVGKVARLAQHRLRGCRGPAT